MASCATRAEAASLAASMVVKAALPRAEAFTGK
jgi:hypothetical protein